MGIVFSYFIKKPLDVKMDKIYDKIISYKRSKTFYDKFAKKFKSLLIISGLTSFGVVTISLYIYQQNKNKICMNIAVYITVIFSTIYVLSYPLKSYVEYKLANHIKVIFDNEQELKKLFITFLEEGSYKKVMMYREKYDPNNELFKDVDIPFINKARISEDNNNEKKMSVTSKDVYLEKKQSSIIIPTVKERTILDKLMDKMLGDGPENRNALICSKCFTHNGLVPPEDYLNVAFKCYNCQQFHPQRLSVSINVPAKLNYSEDEEEVIENPENTEKLEKKICYPSENRNEKD